MRDALRVPLAIAVGVLVVTAAAFGGAVLWNDDVRDVEDFSDEYVAQEAEAFGVVVTSAAVGMLVGAAAYDAFVDTDVNRSELERIDALETKQAIHSQAATKAQDWDTYNQTFSNYLNDTKSIALMEGKNAYIRALNNGSSEAAATQEAHTAIANYYAVKQKNLIASWNTSLIQHNKSWQTAENTTGMSSSFVDGVVAEPNDSHTSRVDVRDFHSGGLTLVNSSSVQAEVIRVNVATGGWSAEHNVSLTTGPVSETDSGDDTTTAIGLGVDRPNENYENITVLEFSEYVNAWERIETQNSEAQTEVDSFINGTYDEYVAGEINDSDLVDPYLGARSYSPDAEFNTWSIRSLSAIGVSPPENLSNVGRMTVETPGFSYTGILMSGEQPAGGFEVGTQYDAGNLNGSQWVVTDDGESVQLDSTFTVESAETADGEEFAENETIRYTDVEYGTSNTSEYEDLMQNLTELQAEINAKQQQERSGGGGGGLFPGGLGSIGGIGGVALIAAAGGAFLLARD